MLTLILHSAFFLFLQRPHYGSIDWMRHLRELWIENGRPPTGQVKGQDKVNKANYFRQMTANLLPAQKRQLEAGRLPAFYLVTVDDPIWKLLDRFFSAIQDTTTGRNEESGIKGWQKLTKSQYEDKLCRRSACIGVGKSSIIDGSLTAFKFWSGLKADLLRTMLEDLLGGNWARWLREEQGKSEEYLFSADDLITKLRGDFFVNFYRRSVTYQYHLKQILKGVKSKRVTRESLIQHCGFDPYQISSPQVKHISNSAPVCKSSNAFLSAGGVEFIKLVFRCFVLFRRCGRSFRA